MNKSHLKEFEDNLKFYIETARKPLVFLETFDYGYVIDVVKKITNDSKSVIIYNHAKRYAHELEKDDSPITTIQSLGHFIPLFMSGQLNDKNRSSSAKGDELANKKILVARVLETMFEKGGNNKIEENLVAKLQYSVYQNSIKDDNEKKTILLVATKHFEIGGLEHICERLSVPLPDKDDIHEELDIEIGKDENGKPIFKYPYAADFKRDKKTRKNKEDLIDALYGMNLYDIRDILHSLKAQSNGKIRLDIDGEKLPERVNTRKKQLVKNSGLLEVIELKNRSKYHEKVGGIDGLRDYLQKQKKKMSPLYLRSKLPKPKGILLVGAPGCGKSESAKATASILELPLYRLNIGDLLGHKYGQSENRFNEALRTADASAPCVLWIDEIEKAFAGAGNEQNNDDTLTHIIGRFLTWMQEHETLVYLVATANDLSKMRPELLRKGRWDEIFYLSYPDIPSIKEILSRKQKEFNIEFYDENKQITVVPDNIVNKMKGMSGAEIVSMLVEAANNDFPYDTQDDGEEIKIPVTIDNFNKLLIKVLDKKKTKENDLEEKINKEIIELKLRYLDNFDEKKERIARKELEIKFKLDDANEYEAKGYKSASNKEIEDPIN